jgi:hypothetical protein
MATVVKGRKVNINLRSILGHLQRYIKLILITATGGKQTRYAGADQPPEGLDPEPGVGAAKCSYPQYARRQRMTGPSVSAFCFLVFQSGGKRPIIKYGKPVKYIDNLRNNKFSIGLVKLWMKTNN